MLKHTATFLSPIRIGLGLLIVLNVLIYSRAADGPYVTDDVPNLVDNNQLIIKHLDFENIKKAALSSKSSPFYRPVSMLTFAANYTLAGNKSPYPIKLTNIFVHVLIGLGIFLLTVNLLPKFTNQSLLHHDSRQVQLIALLTAAIWMFHPLFVSTVLYSIQRMAMLSALFVIYGCLIYIRLRQKTIDRGPGLGSIFFWMTFIAALAFFSKENGFLLFGFLLLIELFCFHFNIHSDTASWKRHALIIYLAVPVLFVLAYLGYTYFSSMNDEITSYLYTYHERLLTQLRVMWRYAGWLTFLNPEPMGLYHDDTIISRSLTEPITTLLALLAWLAVIIVMAVFHKTRHLCIFCCLWFLWGHALESSVLPLAVMFEHRNYLPGYGLILGFVALIIEFLRSLDAARLIKSGFVLILLILLPVYLLHERVENWRDQKSLTLALLERHPNSPQTLIMVARFLNDSGDYENSLKAIRVAQELDKREPSHVLAEAALHCDRKPDNRFDKELIAKLLQRQRLLNVSVNTIRQFRQLTRVCLRSSVNFDTLLALYNQLKQSRNNTLAMLAYYGIGAIQLHRNKYQQTIAAWEMAIDKDKNALGLLPTLEKVRRQYRQQRSGTATERGTTVP
ncbi:MAG: tetratricopeptide repeat protein [Gammaproteobacteria bacterium]